MIPPGLLANSGQNNSGFDGMRAPHHMMMDPMQAMLGHQSGNMIGQHIHHPFSS